MCSPSKDLAETVDKNKCHDSARTSVSGKDSSAGENLTGKKSSDQEPNAERCDLDRHHNVTRHHGSERHHKSERSHNSERHRDSDRGHNPERRRHSDRGHNPERRRNLDRDHNPERHREADRSHNSERQRHYRDVDRSHNSERHHHHRDVDRSHNSERRHRDTDRGYNSGRLRNADRDHNPERRHDADRDRNAERRRDADRDSYSERRHDAKEICKSDSNQAHVKENESKVIEGAEKSCDAQAHVEMEKMGKSDAKHHTDKDPDANKDGKVEETHGAVRNVDANKPKDDFLTLKTGGAYIPPAKLKMMQKEITDKSSPAYQRLAWEALKKSLNGLINKVNVSNITIIVKEELFQENLIRGRGLLCRAIMQAQAASPTFTHVYASLVAIINTKFPQIGELLLHRLIIQFKRGYRLNNKANCLSATRFLAHLINQQVAHEVLALEILTLLLENATEDSVEIAVGFLKECGMKLMEVSPKGVHAIFERLRNILHEANLDRRYQYMIEVIFAVRKDGFKDNPSIIEELDLVDEEDQFTHLTTLDDVTNGQETLNIFTLDPAFEENEERYRAMRMEILDQGSSEESSEGEGGSEEEGSEENEEGKNKDILDSTETELVSLRRTIYLTIQSSLDFEECAHKLLKMEMRPGQEKELCHMILDCCAQMRTYEKFFGLLAQRFCDLDKVYQEQFEVVFQDAYDTIHRFDNNKLRNAAKFFAHLLYTDALPWTVLTHVKLNEDDTTSSSRIFIKILFQELAEDMGLARLHERCQDPDELREHLKQQTKPTAVVKPQLQELIQNLESSSSSSSSGSNSSSSSTGSPDSESEGAHKKTSRKNKKQKKKSRKKKKNAKQRSGDVESSDESDEENLAPNGVAAKRKTGDRKKRKRKPDDKRRKSKKRRKEKSTVNKEEEAEGVGQDGVKRGHKKKKAERKAKKSKETKKRSSVTKKAAKRKRGSKEKESESDTSSSESESSLSGKKKSRVVDPKQPIVADMGFRNTAYVPSLQWMENPNHRTTAVS